MMTEASIKLRPGTSSQMDALNNHNNQHYTHLQNAVIFGADRVAVPSKRFGGQE
jgi:hypothetical protein